jgi:hypothetical protein
MTLKNNKYLNMKKKVIIFLTVMLLISCKNEEKKTEKDQIVSVPNFTVEISAYTSKPDDFALYFREDGSINYAPENAIWNKKEISDGIVNFIVPEEKLPSNIRLDFGINKQQDSVVIKSIKIKYLKEVFEIKGSDFLKYFGNQEVEFKTKLDNSKKSFTIYKEGSEFKTPFYYQTELLSKKLSQITGKPVNKS